MGIIIVGGGISGLTLALMLKARGIDSEVYEAASRIDALGVGINLLPGSTAELAEIGLLDRLDAVAVRTRELIYTNRFGQEIWREARGLDAGYRVPQLSVHRGRLQVLLRDAVVERLGAGALHTGHALTSFAQRDGRVEARFELRSEGGERAAWGDVLIGCDGIHSVVRKALVPDDGGLRWTGFLMWRGATVARGFLDGRTMVVSGGLEDKLVLYPIADGPEPGTHLVNWAVCRRLGDGSTPPPRREDWTRRASVEDVMPHVARFRTTHVDPKALVTQAPAVFEYPMADRDPLPRWTHGRVTLLGDAAHPMYPMGSNGAGQAILDARCLADRIAACRDLETALHEYEAERLPKTTEIVRLNRRGGPEGVIEEVERRAPDGFERIDDVLGYEERERIVRGYAWVSGFAKEQVNRE